MGSLGMVAWGAAILRRMGSLSRLSKGGGQEGVAKMEVCSGSTLLAPLCVVIWSPNRQLDRPSDPVIDPSSDRSTDRRSDRPSVRPTDPQGVAGAGVGIAVSVHRILECERSDRALERPRPGARGGGCRARCGVGDTTSMRRPGRRNSPRFGLANVGRHPVDIAPAWVGCVWG